MKKTNVGSMDLCTLTWLNKANSILWLSHPHPPLGMTPLNGVTLEDLAPGVEVMTAGMLTWATGALEEALEAALEAVTTAEKAGTRDSASTKCGGGDYSWNSFDLLGERGEEEARRWSIEDHKTQERMLFVKSFFFILGDLSSFPS
ncbi:unnamed protein product [Cuscuta epithymum]|uniref:Uncharacterized protein n=1 Tax=Cuscuta epithymum TaxID=186058 RepID=A0AAV0F5L4_9ASTE|nr:unnamed protein product [Cuscuta epithymum]